MSSYHLDHLEYLETEAIHVLREVAAGFERPAVLFSGGKDSICILRLAEKAFRPSDIPMPFLNVETGHEFPELIEFRDRRAEEMGAKLIVRTVDEAIEKGLATATPGQTSRNKLQIPVLLGAIDEFQFDCCIGGARRDEAARRTAACSGWPSSSRRGPRTRRSPAPRAGSPARRSCCRAAPGSAHASRPTPPARRRRR